MKGFDCRPDRSAKDLFPLEVINPVVQRRRPTRLVHTCTPHEVVVGVNRGERKKVNDASSVTQNFRTYRRGTTRRFRYRIRPRTIVFVTIQPKAIRGTIGQSGTSRCVPWLHRLSRRIFSPFASCVYNDRGISVARTRDRLV